jgi:hypothetical protein
VKPLIVFCVILNISDLILMDARDIAGCVPVRVAPKCPTPRGCDQVLRHIACPLTVNASIRAAPEEMLTFMSLLRSGLLGTDLETSLRSPAMQTVAKAETN